MVRESRIDLVSGELPKQLEALLNYGMNYACMNARRSTRIMDTQKTKFIHEISNAQLDIAKVAVDRLSILSAEIYQFLPICSLLHPSPWQRWTERICTYPDILVQPYLLECRLKKGFQKVFWMENSFVIRHSSFVRRNPRLKTWD